MCKTMTLISGLSIGIFVLLVGSAAAAGVGTEAGNWEYTFDSPASNADIAAENYQYNENTLARVGSEAGNWRYNPDAPVTKAERAAQNHQYDQDALAKVGTEAGDWQSPSRGAVANDELIANEGKTTETICKGC